MSSQSSHHPQEVLLAQFSLYVHKGRLKPDSFYFILLYVTGPREKQALQIMCSTNQKGGFITYNMRVEITTRLLHCMIYYNAIQNIDTTW